MATFFTHDFVSTFFEYVIIYAAAQLTSWLVGGAVAVLLNRRPIQSIVIRRRQIVRECVFSASSVFVLSFMIAASLQTGLMRTHPSEGSLVLMLSLAVLIVVHDAYFYWGHRLLHLWPLIFIHRLHHHSRRVTVLSASSVHPMEAALDGTFLIFASYFVPLSDVLIAGFTIYLLARNTLAHLGREIFPATRQGLPLFDFLTTVTHHDIHHSSYSTNFSFCFTWWDRLMGTEYRDYHLRFAQARGKTATEGFSDMVSDG